MTNFMKALTFAAVLVSTLSYSQAFSPNNNLDALNSNDILINKPEASEGDHKSIVQIACYGCISNETGRPRTNYVKPHYRSNGTYVSGYWRS